MPRNMSFAMTTPQFRARTKTVTRRFGWWFLKPGDIVMGVEKAMGLGKGGRIKRLGLIRVRTARAEPLDTITIVELVLEGFPQMTPAEFVEMMCAHRRCEPNEPVNRIEFKYLD